MRMPNLMQQELAGRVVWTRRFLLWAFALCLLFAVPSEASLQCPPSSADAAIRIETVAPSDVPLSNLSGKPRPVAAFRITGTRPKRVMRLGFQSWSKGHSAPEPPRDGYVSDCAAFEHLVVLWVREVTLKGSAKLLVGYRYVFENGSTKDSEIVMLPISGSVPPQFRVLEGATAIPAEADLPLWGVFLDGAPEPGEGIAETAARADRALVLKVRNSDS